MRCCVLGKNTLRLQYFQFGPSNLPVVAAQKSCFALVWLNRRRVPVSHERNETYPILVKSSVFLEIQLKEQIQGLGYKNIFRRISFVFVEYLCNRNPKIKKNKKFNYCKLPELSIDASPLLKILQNDQLFESAVFSALGNRTSS